MSKGIITATRKTAYYWIYENGANIGQPEVASIEVIERAWMGIMYTMVSGL